LKEPQECWGGGCNGRCERREGCLYKKPMVIFPGEGGSGKLQEGAEGIWTTNGGYERSRVIGPDKVERKKTGTPGKERTSKDTFRKKKRTKKAGTMGTWKILRRGEGAGQIKGFQPFSKTRREVNRISSRGDGGTLHLNTWVKGLSLLKNHQPRQANKGKRGGEQGINNLCTRGWFQRKRVHRTHHRSFHRVEVIYNGGQEGADLVERKNPDHLTTGRSTCLVNARWKPCRGGPGETERRELRPRGNEGREKRTLRERTWVHESWKTVKQHHKGGKKRENDGHFWSLGVSTRGTNTKLRGGGYLLHSHPTERRGRLLGHKESAHLGNSGVLLIQAKRT